MRLGDGCRNMSDDMAHVQVLPDNTDALVLSPASPQALASIVPVMAWAGETEEEALKRYGIDNDRPGAEIVFLHLN